MNPIFLIIMLNLIQNSIAFQFTQHSFVRQYMAFNSSHSKTSQKSMDSKIRCSSLCQQTSDPKCVGYCYEEADGQCNFYHEAVAVVVVVADLSTIQTAMNQFTEARNFCVNNGGILALPIDEDENQELASFLITNRINSVWLRVRQDDTVNGEWHDNEKNGPIIGYSNWTTSPIMLEIGGCGQLSADGMWSEVSCQDANLPFVCTDPSANEPTTTPAPTPEEPVEQGQTCYKLLN